LFKTVSIAKVFRYILFPAAARKLSLKFLFGRARFPALGGNPAKKVALRFNAC